MDRDVRDIVLPRVSEQIAARRWADLRAQFSAWEVTEVAELLQELEKNERVMLLRSLDRERSAEVFSYLDIEDQDGLLRELTDAETRNLLSELDPDDRAALLDELPARMTKRLMALLSPDDLKEVRFLLGYPEESVGRLMTPYYVAIEMTDTVDHALRTIRERGQDSETINRIYVRDQHGKLLDDIPLRRLILADPSVSVSDLMDRNFVSLSAYDDREQAVDKMRDYDMVALPVVDSQGILLGIVTIDDVMDVAEEEATEDIQRAASVEPLRMSYRQASIWTLYRKRIVWLAILVAVNLVSASIIGLFEAQLQQVIVLATFIPLLLGTAGNAGTQSATLMLRALVTGDVEMGEWFRTVGKELMVGLFLGVTLGGLGFALGAALSGTYAGLQIGAVVGLSMICIVFTANLVGMTLPFLLARVKLDPAVASNPLISTITDATGLFIYFAIASRVLNL
jgi:magnesium transporter